MRAVFLMLCLLPAMSLAQAVDDGWQHLYSGWVVSQGDPHLHSGTVQTLIDSLGGPYRSDPPWDPSIGVAESCLRPKRAYDTAVVAGLDWLNIATHDTTYTSENEIDWWKTEAANQTDPCHGEVWPTGGTCGTDSLDPGTPCTQDSDCVQGRCYAFDLSVPQDGIRDSDDVVAWYESEAERAAATHPDFIPFMGLEWSPGASQPSSACGGGGHKIVIRSQQTTPLGLRFPIGSLGWDEVLPCELDLLEDSVAKGYHVHLAHPCQCPTPGCSSAPSAYVGPPYPPTGGGLSKDIGGYDVTRGVCLFPEDPLINPGESSFVDYLNQGYRGSAWFESDLHTKGLGAGPGCTGVCSNALASCVTDGDCPGGTCDPPAPRGCRFHARSLPYGANFDLGTDISACWVPPIASGLPLPTRRALVMEGILADRCYGHRGLASYDRPVVRTYIARNQAHWAAENPADPPAVIGQDLEDDDDAELYLVLRIEDDAAPAPNISRVRLLHNDATSTGYVVLGDCDETNPQPSAHFQCSFDSQRAVEVTAHLTGASVPDELDGWYFWQILNRPPGTGTQIVAIAGWRNYLPYGGAEVPSLPPAGLGALTGLLLAVTLGLGATVGGRLQRARKRRR